MVRTSIIYIIFIIAYFGNSLVGYKIAPPQLIWSLEILIYFLFLYALMTTQQKVVFPFVAFILFFILIAIFSMLVNHSFSFEPIYGLRLLIRFYLFFLALINLDLTDQEIKKINKFIFIIFIIQIPVATLKLFIYGFGERAIGTYSLTEGSLSTVIPLIAIGYLISYYFYYKRTYWFLLISFGFLYFSIIAKKRALVFMLPILILMQIIAILKEKNIDFNLKKIIRHRAFTVAPFIIIIVIYFSIRLVPALNPEKKIGGSFNPVYTLNVFEEYFTRKPDDFGYTTSRFSTTKRVFSVLYEQGFSRIFFGYGPGSYTESRFLEKEEKRSVYKDMRINYGLTPLSYIAIEYGILGIIPFFALICSFFVRSVKFWKVADSGYWKAYSLGSMGFAFSMILLWASYHIPSFTGDPIPCLYFYAMAVVSIKFRQYKFS